MKNFAIAVLIVFSFGACDYKNASNGNIDEAYPTPPQLDQGHYENTELKSGKQEMDHSKDPVGTNQVPRVEQKGDSLKSQGDSLHSE